MDYGQFVVHYAELKKTKMKIGTNVVQGPVIGFISGNSYFQPALREQSSRAFGFAFSHSVMESVSSLDILSFIHLQYLITTSVETPSFLLSSMHCAIHCVSYWSANA